MEYRRLGSHGLVVSSVGLGCMGMSGSYGPADENEAIATIHHAIDLGVTLFDTADLYGAGANEELVGRAVAHRRDDVVVATKFGFESTPDRSTRIVGRPEYVRTCIDESLRRLGLDHVDLYYQHRVDPDVPIEDTVAAMADLVALGKVRHLGLCEASADTLERAASVHPITALQSEWSLWSRDLEPEIVGCARRLGIGIVPYAPLGRGFLTGQVTATASLAESDMRRHSPRFSSDNLPHNLERLARVQALAEQKGVTAGQLALAWLLAQGDDVVPIPGTKRRSRLEENAGAVDVVLSPDDLEHLEDLAGADAWAGPRFRSNLAMGAAPQYGSTRART